MNSNTLRIAAVQFPLSGDIDKNYRRMAFWLNKAARNRAELVHFPETALTGYYKIHLEDVGKIDRNVLEGRNLDLRSLARKLGVWLAYGSTHFTPEADKPYNCLYLINPEGREVCRYDKIFLTGTDAECYAPGNRLVTAQVKDFKLGLTICFDMRFPELFRKYSQAGVNLVLISSYQAKGDRARHMKKVAPANLITRAAENGIYLSASNTSESPSWHDSMIIRFNGQVLAKARRHQASMAFATLDSTDSEPFTSFIRQTAQSSLRNTHPLLGRPLAEETLDI
ncbi:MAG TPA: carbon-nitrogen hydrolase family protein [archaeon]|nr:carbon-nitrogen hydrolase family protein [archaeon]